MAGTGRSLESRGQRAAGPEGCLRGSVVVAGSAGGWGFVPAQPQEPQPLLAVF